MEWTKVKSSNVLAVKYLGGDIIQVKFKGTPEKPGGVYEYENVPQAVYEKFIKAESVGKFFNKIIREGRTGRKLPSEEVENDEGLKELLKPEPQAAGGRMPQAVAKMTDPYKKEEEK